MTSDITISAQQLQALLDKTNVEKATVKMLDEINAAVSEMGVAMWFKDHRLLLDENSLGRFIVRLIETVRQERSKENVPAYTDAQLSVIEGA